MADNENATTYDISCPFCFRRYNVHKVLFVDHRKETEHMYREYEQYMKSFLGLESPADRHMPLYFQKRANDGIGSYFAAETETGDISYIRACPYCCNILPAAAGRVRPFSLVVTGADDEQRGFYISSVLHGVNGRLPAEYGASFIPSDHGSALRFYEQYEEPLYIQKVLPEPVMSLYPLVYEFDRTGNKEAETWDHNEVTYNRALVYIYNIGKDICDRYPMVAYNAIEQSSGMILVSDLDETAKNSEPLTDVWLGFLTETFRRIHGAGPMEKPSAMILDNADGVFKDNRKWTSLLKAAKVRKKSGKFPAKYYSKLSTKTKSIIGKKLPAYAAVLDSLFSSETTMYFPSAGFYRTDSLGSAEIRNTETAQASFLWMLSKLDMINDDSVKNFRMSR